MVAAARYWRISLSVLLALLLVEWAMPVNGNFFSRVRKFGKDDDKPAPSGAANAMGSGAQVGSMITFRDGIPFANLGNNNKIPLVGFGVGNLQSEFIPGMVAASLKESRKTILIDTASKSNNEHLVAEGILKAVERLEEGETLEVHVVTKVWYTHLGYERTKLSVQNSLAALKPALENERVDLQLHLLLHWPRCFDNISWMDCEREERELSDEVKSAGPDPSQDPDNAWKASWKYLEDIYLSDQYPIASIGVSNFHLQDLEAMESFARIPPHILQVNVWSLLYDAHLIEYCHKHRIHVQAYNTMGGTISQPERAPKAYHHIQKVAIEISEQIGRSLTPAQVILAWLIQHGVSVIPRTSNIFRLDENSALSLVSIPAMTDHQVETIAHAVEAYLSGQDLEQDIHVHVTFHAVNENIMLYWMGHEGEVRLSYIPKGDSFEESTYPFHRYRTYLASNKDVYIEHEIDANFGDHKEIHVEL